MSDWLAWPLVVLRDERAHEEMWQRSNAMSLRMICDGVVSRGDSVWYVHLQPEDVRQLGAPEHAIGKRSLLMVTGAVFDDARRRLEFDVPLCVLNLGTTDEVIVIDAGRNRSGEPLYSSRSSPLVAKVNGHRVKDSWETVACRSDMKITVLGACPSKPGTKAAEFFGLLETGLTVADAVRVGRATGLADSTLRAQLQRFALRRAISLS